MSSAEAHHDQKFGLGEAIFLAVAAHARQLDKGDGSPYVRHLFRVMEAVAEHGETAMIVAVLHDIVEDTWVTLAHLRQIGASEEVIEAIDSVTKRDGEDYDSLLRRARQNPLGLIVKLADNADNSDEARLALFPADKAAYFRNKYAHARRILNGQA